MGGASPRLESAGEYWTQRDCRIWPALPDPIRPEPMDKIFSILSFPFLYQHPAGRRYSPHLTLGIIITL
jgi:hypothetical protein